MTVYAFIPARGGSTRVPRKNLQEVGGVSLLNRARRVAHEVGAFAVVSTDCDEVAFECGKGQRKSGPVYVHRRPTRYEDLPSWLGTLAPCGEIDRSAAQIEWWIAHWIGQAQPNPDDVIVLLQPTSPFRSAETVRRCVAALNDAGGWSMTVTACPEAYFRGTLDLRMRDSRTSRVRWHESRRHRPRSQDLSSSVREDGCVYAFTAQAFMSASGCRMEPSRKPRAQAVVEVSRLESFEIDTPEDLQIARWIAAGMAEEATSAD